MFFFYLFNFEIKDKQLDVINHVIENKVFSVFVSLPTGFGKSRCYVVPPVILDKVRLLHDCPFDPKAIMNIFKFFIISNTLSKQLEIEF